MCRELELEYTNHARERMVLRKLLDTWIEGVIAEPTLRGPDPRDPEIERFYGPVPELGNYYIRVAVNTTANPWRVVTVFVDSKAGGEL